MNISKGNWAGVSALDALGRNSSTASNTNCLPPSHSSGCRYFHCEQDVTLEKGERRVVANFRLGVTNDSEKLIGALTCFHVLLYYLTLAYVR